MVHHYCPFCWREISADDKNCPHCGSNMKKWDEKSFTEKLIQALNHPLYSTAYRVCRILGEKREKAAVRPLIELLNRTSDHFLMDEIVEALGKIGDVSTVPYLIEMLHNRSFLVRGKAAAILGNLKGRGEIAEALKDATKDCSSYVRESAIDSLNKLTAR